MSFLDKIKDTLSGNKDEQAADAAKEAAERAAQQQRDEAEAREADARAAEERAAAEAAAAVPGLSVGRVREIVAHDSNPNTPTGQGLDKEAGMILESALRRALDQLGLPNRDTDDGSLGTMFLESYSRWQGHLGYSGNDADGVPGRESLTKLAEFTGAFTVVD